MTSMSAERPDRAPGHAAVRSVDLTKLAATQPHDGDDCGDDEGDVEAAEVAGAAVEADRRQHDRPDDGAELVHQLLHRARDAEVGLGDRVGRQ